MDKFHTRVEIPKPAETLGYHTPSLWMGSCFADTIGKIMAEAKFPVLLNPFGTLFNPHSIGDNLRRLVTGESFRAEQLEHHNGLWFSFSCYTLLSHHERETCLSNLNRSLQSASRWLEKSSFLFITLGTARIFQRKDTGEVVANCHKLPASAFTTRLLQPAEIIHQFETVLAMLRNYNPNIRVVFTVSPVRHWSDGAVNNQLSKSILHYSIHELIKNHNQVSYFPAYEIFMDELRDYRFYAADMLHPSDQGSHYVWERFAETWLDAEAKKIMAGVTAVIKAAGHRPQHAESTNHKKFVHATRLEIERLSRLYPFLDFSNEIALLPL
jgi:hypothetical protein